MHIALIHYSAPPVVGGVESVLAQHARLMAQAGHSVRILAARGAPLSDHIPFISLPLIDSRHPRVLTAKAQLDRGIMPDDFASLTGEITDALREALTGVDVLIAHNVCSLNKNLMLTAAIQRLTSPHVTLNAVKGKVVSQPTEILRPHGTQNDMDRKLRVILWHHDLAWTTPRYQAEMHDGYPWDLLRTDWGARHVVVSDLRQRELADLLHIPLESIAVVPNGIDQAAFFKLSPITLSLLDRLQMRVPPDGGVPDKTPGIFEDAVDEHAARPQIDLARAAPILLLPVRITPRKNIELALRTLAELRREMPETILIVTGPLGAHNPANEAYFAKLKTLWAELDLLGAAIFLAEFSEEHAARPSTSPLAPYPPSGGAQGGTLAITNQMIPAYLPDDVIADFYRLADALLLPSREEGFGIPVVEAAFSRLPVFCTDITPLRALGRDDAVYFSPDDDPARIAGLIVQRLQRDAAYHSAARARRLFSWDSIYRDHIAPLLEERDGKG